MQIRKPAVAGQFYPGDRTSLLSMLRKLFTEVEKPEQPNAHINALISPHAGYVFSGKQAAKAYTYLNKGQYDLVCIISPSHREYFPYISVFSGEAYKTPLGECSVDSKAKELALSCEGFISGKVGHKSEHALEVQLPFIQYVLGDIPILPIVMGDQNLEMIEKVAECIKRLYTVYNEKILFIASSDLSHFHPAIVAKEMDGMFIELLDNADVEQIHERLNMNELEACGGGPIMAILKGIDIGENEIKVLGYSHSGEILHDDASVVGYTSAVMVKGNK